MHRTIRNSITSKNSLEKNQPKQQEVSRTQGFTQAYFTPTPILPFSKNPRELSNWLSINHPGYNLASWCFYGNVETASGEIIAVNSIFQQQFGLKDKMPYLAEFSFCDSNTNGYAIAPFLVFPFDIKFNPIGEPFSVTAFFDSIPKLFVKLSLISGEMGAKGARYEMSGLVVDLRNEKTEWKYDIQLTDTFGSIQVGYGPSSFQPQWLTPPQKQTIVNNYNSDVHAYLNATQDEMKGQGSYYFSIPLLNVDSFYLQKNGELYASGSKGNIWVDYVVQGFDSASLPILGSAKWEFFAIQFPSSLNDTGLNAALIVSLVTTTDQTGSPPYTLKMARFYDNSPSSKKALNGANEAIFEWKMNEITFTPKNYWPPDNEHQYPTEFDLELISPNGTIRIKAAAVRQNQVIQEVHKYEGVFDVTASIALNGIDQETIKGYAWSEVH